MFVIIASAMWYTGTFPLKTWPLWTACFVNAFFPYFSVINEFLIFQAFPNTISHQEGRGAAFLVSWDVSEHLMAFSSYWCIILQAPYQSAMKPGRRCNHTTWCSASLWGVFSWK